MSTDQDDDDDDDEIERYLDHVLQREIDRRVAELADRLPPCVQLDADLQQLEDRIADDEILRNIGIGDVEPYMLGRFEAITSMRGGMGLVIKARDRQLERDVAIKLWMRSGPAAQEALLAEAKTLAQLKHPNVVTIYEPGFWRDRVFLVMEWIEGVDGHDWLDVPRSWRAVRRVYMAAGTGLAAAHDAGIQHRDFKPSNILIGEDGRVVVADFGVADSLHALPEFDAPGRVVGTPGYVAPERLRGSRGDARSDQFSFCVAMWRSLCGQRPFAGNTREELLESIERGEVRETPDVEVPAWLRAVVRKGLAADPGQRYRDMHELLTALRDAPPSDDEGDEDEVFDEPIVEDDGRVLHTPEHEDEPAVAREGSVAQDFVEVRGRARDDPEAGDSAWSRWPVVAVSFVASLILVTGLVIFRRSPAPEPSVSNAVEVRPYHAILGLVAADEFLEAEKVWRTSELSDMESLRIAEECLGRAKELEHVDPSKSEQAVLIAHKVATAVEEFGATPEARERGGRLASAATNWWNDEQ